MKSRNLLFLGFFFTVALGDALNNKARLFLEWVLHLPLLLCPVFICCSLIHKGFALMHYLDFRVLQISNKDPIVRRHSTKSRKRNYCYRFANCQNSVSVQEISVQDGGQTGCSWEMTWIILAVIATQISSRRCSSPCCFYFTCSDVWAELFVAVGVIVDVWASSGLHHRADGVK